MRCPVHPDVWLYENTRETEGYCPACKKWYPLEEPGEMPAQQQRIEQVIRELELKLPYEQPREAAIYKEIIALLKEKPQHDERGD